MTTTYLNRNFRIVYEPKNLEFTGGKRRLFVGAGRLADYIGEDNARMSFDRALASTGDKIRIKLRKLGIVDIYVK